MTMRIIPRLDIKGPNLVKGVHLEGLRVLGKPWRYAKYYYEQGADELVYMDVVASLYDRNGILDLIEKTAKEIFIPITVGGGIRSIEDIRSALMVGADKVAINTAAIKNPDLVRNAANRFGASTIVISIDAQRKTSGYFECYTENGRQPTGKNAVEWAKQAAELGAGEILITSIDQEGTGRGYDIELVRMIAESVPIPVIACGGAGEMHHFQEVVVDGKADAICLASMLHYNLLEVLGVEADFHTDEGNIDFLRSRKVQYRATHTSIPALKKYLLQNLIPCRQVGGAQSLGG